MSLTIETIEARIISMLTTNMEESMSATKISKRLGYSKANSRVKDVLSSMFDRCLLSVTEVGNNMYYFKNKDADERESLRIKIIDVLPKNIDDAMSLTAISKDLGFSKIDKKIAEIVINLKNDGFVEETTILGKYKAFYISSDPKKENLTSTKEVSRTNTTQDYSKYKLPKNSHGYTIEETSSGYKVTMPNGNSSVDLEAGERLLVLNNDESFQFVISKPEEVFEAIRLYTTEKRIGSFLVKNMETNENIDKASIDKIMDTVIIFVGVERHNKAAS